MTPPANQLSLLFLRGSVEHLYDFCSKHIQNGMEGCIHCPLHAACSQARGMQFSSLEDLMGSYLYWIQQLSGFGHEEEEKA